VWVCVCGREKECRVQSRSMNKVGRKEGGQKVWGGRRDRREQERRDFYFYSPQVFEADTYIPREQQVMKAHSG